MPTINMWTIWKSRNSKKTWRKHNFWRNGDASSRMVWNLVKTLYPWIHLESCLWLEIVKKTKVEQA